MSGRYGAWRGNRIERSVWVWLAAALVLVIIVGYTAQDLPVLPADDIRSIGLPMALLSGAVAFAGALLGRRRRSTSPVPAGIAGTSIAVVIEAVAVFFYKSVGGVGWPDWWQLVLAAVVVGGAAAAGMWVGHHAFRLAPFVGFLAAGVFGLFALTVHAVAMTQLDSALRPRGDASDGACEEHGGITYCAFPGQEGTIRYWRATAERVLSQVPSDLAAEGGLIVQSADGRAVAGAIAEPGGGWTTPGEGVAELAMGLDVADWAVGVRDQALGSGCVVDGQARGIVAMWLAGQVSPEAAEIAGSLNVHADAITGSYAESINGGNVAGLYAAQLFERPIADVGEAIRANWDELVDPASDYAVAQRILGLGPVDESSPEDGDEGPESCV